MIGASVNSRGEILDTHGEIFATNEGYDKSDSKRIEKHKTVTSKDDFLDKNKNGK